LVEEHELSCLSDQNIFLVSPDLTRQLQAQVRERRGRNTRSAEGNKHFTCEPKVTTNIKKLQFKDAATLFISAYSCYGQRLTCRPTFFWQDKGEMNGFSVSMNALLTTWKQAEQVMTGICADRKLCMEARSHICDGKREQQDHRKTTDTACCRVK